MSFPTIFLTLMVKAYLLSLENSLIVDLKMFLMGTVDFG